MMFSVRFSHTLHWITLLDVLIFLVFFMIVKHVFFQTQLYISYFCKLCFVYHSYCDLPFRQNVCFFLCHDKLYF